MKKRRIGALIIAVMVIALIIAVLAVAVLIAVFAIRGSGSVSAAMQTSAETPTTTVSTEESYKTVDLAWGVSLKFPAEFSDVLVHEQEVHGGLTTETFSMRKGEKAIPLFRIDFGDETVGDWHGVLNTDKGIVPVVYTVFTCTNEEIEAMDEETREQYFMLMNSFSDVLNTIAADPRFSAEKPLDSGENKEAKMAYWTVTLPGKMSWSEVAEAGEYQAVFYGEVRGEQTALYTVRIGETETGSVLGQFKVGEELKKVSVESFDLSRKTSWTDDDYSVAYHMMDTINDVIQVIMSSEYYSEAVIG